MEIPCASCRSPDFTIDDCYYKVLRTFTEQGTVQENSKRLLTLRKNHEKVLHAYNLLKTLDLLPKVKTNTKDNNVSIYYRNLGNDCFKHNKNCEAWQYYNLSLLYAGFNSENFVYAVANRSAVFFDMKKYKECLEDIKFVFATTFPEKIRAKLINRKEKCEAELKKISESMTEEDYQKKYIAESEIADYLKLKTRRNQRYICASSKLEVVYTEAMGRHVIATEDIKVGEVLSQEDPYLAVLLKEHFLFTCAYCLSRTMNLYPCKSCTYTLYCSVDCRETAYTKYHMTECALLPSLISMNFTKLEWIALRILLRSMTDQPDWQHVFMVAKAAESTLDSDISGCAYVGTKWVYDSRFYHSIHTLSSNVEKRSVSDLFRKCISAAALLHFMSVLQCLKNDNALMSIQATEYSAGTLMHHIMTSPTNMHNISTNQADANGNYVEECNIASGAYAFFSLINHSCAPNVVRYSKLGSARMTLIAIRPIKKGMQIFDNYGSHHALQDRDTRRNYLRFQYKFDCECEACVNDWPLYPNMKTVINDLPLNIKQKKDFLVSLENHEGLMKGDKEIALKCYKPLCELIEQLEPYAPCQEQADCQESMKQCLSIFQGLAPYCSTRIECKAFPPCEATGGPPHFTGYISGPTLT